MSLQPALTNHARLALWGLITATAIDALGATMVLPILPLFVRHAGGSDAEVGLVTAVFWAAGLVARYPIGRLSDRLGRKWLLAISELVYAAATAAFAASPSPLWFVVLRAVQGAAAGAVTVLSMAAVADFVPLERRGRAYGALVGANMAGTIVGPLIGAALFEVSVASTFLASAGAALLVAAVIVMTIPGGVQAPQAEAGRDAKRAYWRDRVVVGVILTSAALGVLIGIYDTVWSLLMHARHATDFEIGLSFALFALPFALGSWPAGWLADRVDNRWLIVASSVAGGAFALVYPFLPTPFWLIVLGVFEGVLTVTGAPARLALLSRQVLPHQMGAVQGLYGSVQVGASAASALVAGALFSLNLVLPFVVIAASMWVSALALLPLWMGVDGRPRRSSGPLPEASLSGPP